MRNIIWDMNRGSFHMDQLLAAITALFCRCASASERAAVSIPNVTNTWSGGSVRLPVADTVIAGKKVS